MEVISSLSENYADFDSIKVIYKIEGTVINESPLRIGSGSSEALGQVDQPVLMMKYKERRIPVIPGSSWKGALRSEAERFVRSSQELGRDKGWERWRACDIFSDEEREREENDPCVVCLLFGNTGLASHLRIFDSIPIGRYSLETITRVAIDRITGTQSSGKLFKVQVVSPGTLWSFKMTLINVDPTEDGEVSFLARYLLNKLTEGIQIGGGRSVGYGLVRLVKEKISVKKLEVSPQGLTSSAVDFSSLIGR